METVHKFENMLDGWLKPIPHLPKDWRKWLAINVWWLTMVFVILSAFGVLALTGALLATLSIFGFSATFYGMYSPQMYTGWWVFTTFVALAFLVATVIAAGASVNPLREMSKKGWDLLFLSYVITFSSTLVSTVLKFNMIDFVPNLFSLVVTAAVGAYLLFEVREYFGKKKTSRK